jgi:hypothetical protein
VRVATIIGISVSLAPFPLDFFVLIFSNSDANGCTLLLHWMDVHLSRLSRLSTIVLWVVIHSDLFQSSVCLL